jgi:hypothetical protein
MDIKEISEIAKTKLAELTGFSLPNVIGIDRKEDTWNITIEITEKPSEATNLEILGIYQVRLDASGTLLGYERIRLRKRGDIQTT